MYRRPRYWTDSQGRSYHGRKADGWPIDGKAVDDVIADGYRRIRPGGRVKLGGLMCSHRDLIQYAGRMARVEVNDFWYTGLIVRLGHPEATPESILDRSNGHHSSFYQGTTYPCFPVEDSSTDKEK